MNKQRRSLKLINYFSIGFLSLLASVTAHAQEQLGVAGNSITVSNAGGGFGPTSVPISTGGVVSTVSNVPTSGVLDVPTFSFTMVSNGVTDGTYSFAAGFIVDENGSDRRLELRLPTVNMTFSGGGATLAGTVPNSQTVRVLGRSADGSVTAFVNTTSSGIVNFTGNQLSFDADDQLALIAGLSSPLDDIINTINTTGLTYTYTVVLKQTSGPATLIFGANPGGSFTAYPTSAGDFILNTNDLQATFTGGHKLTGQLSFGSGGGGGGGGGGSTPPAEGPTVEENLEDVASDTSSLSTDIILSGVTEETVDLYSDIVLDTAAIVDSVSDAIESGDATTEQGIELLGSLLDQIQIGQSIVSAGEELPVSTVTQSVANVSTVIEAFIGRNLSTSESSDIESLVTSTISDTAALLDALRGKFGFLKSSPGVIYSAITLDTSLADIAAIMDSVQATVANALQLDGVSLGSSMFASVQDLSQTATELTLAPLGTQLGLSLSYSDVSTTRDLLAGNSTLFSRLIDVVGVSANQSDLDTNATGAALQAAGLGSSAASALAGNLNGFSNPFDALFNNGFGFSNVSSVIESALGADTISVDSLTSTVSYSVGSDTYTVLVSAVIPAPDAFPTGQFTMPDGSTLVVEDSLAVLLVSASADIVGFAAAIESVGAGAFSTSIDDDGSITLTELATGVDFIAGFSSATASDGATGGGASFGAPAGDPTDSGYFFTVNFDDGSSQSIVPLMADSRFFDSVSNAGFELEVSRDTGIIEINGFRFKPDYFAIPLTTDDFFFRVANGDSAGVAYRAVDANNDGITDYEVVTTLGVQVVYGLP